MRQQIAVRAAAGVDAQLAAMRAKIAKRELAAHRSDCIFSAASGSAADADAALDAPAAADAAAPGDAHEDAAESEKMQSEASNDGRDVAERCDAADGLNLPTPQPPRSPTPRSPTPEPCAPEPCAAEPCAAEPCTAEPCAAEPCTAEPRAAEPCAAEPCAAEPCAAEPRAASQAFGYGAPQSPTAEQVARYEASPGRASSQGSPRASSQGSPRHFSRGSLEARESASPPRWRARRGTARDGASEARREEDSRQLARPRNGARNGRSRRDDDGDWRSDPDSDVSGDGGRSNRRAHAVSRRGARRDAEDRIAPMLYDERVWQRGIRLDSSTAPSPRSALPADELCCGARHEGRFERAGAKSHPMASPGQVASPKRIARATCPESSRWARGPSATKGARANASSWRRGLHRLDGAMDAIEAAERHIARATRAISAAQRDVDDRRIRLDDAKRRLRLVLL